MILLFYTCFISSHNYLPWFQLYFNVNFNLKSILELWKTRRSKQKWNKTYIEWNNANTNALFLLFAHFFSSSFWLNSYFLSILVYAFLKSVKEASKKSPINWNWIIPIISYFIWRALIEKPTANINF